MKQINMGFGKTPPRPNQDESIIKSQIIRYLYLCPEFFGWVTTNGGIWDPTRKIFRTRNGIGMINGIADICGIWNGSGLQLEIKTRYGKLSEAQVRFLNQFRTKGGVSAVLRSIEDAELLVAALRKSGTIPSSLTKDFMGEK